MILKFKGKQFKCATHQQSILAYMVRFGIATIRRMPQTNCNPFICDSEYVLLQCWMQNRN